MKSVIAGMLIALAAVIYLAIGTYNPIIGSMFFSLGLLTILMYKFDLFTGKAGKLSTGAITGVELCKIWCGNFIGVIITSLLAINWMSPAITNAAQKIVTARVCTDPISLIVGGIFCGMLMYIATAANTPRWMTIMCVMAFIGAGFYHCVADMAYVCLARTVELKSLWSLAFVTIGNIIGCNIIPTMQKFC